MDIQQGQIDNKKILSGGAKYQLPALASLGAEHLGIALSIASAVPLVSLDRLDADLAIRLTRPEEASHTRRRLGSMRFGLFAAENYDIQAAGRRFIGYSQRFDALPQLSWLIEQAGSDGLAVRIDDIAGQRAAALARIGISLLPDFMVEATEQRLKRVPWNASPPCREIWLAQHQDAGRVLGIGKHLTRKRSRCPLNRLLLTLLGSGGEDHAPL